MFGKKAAVAALLVAALAVAGCAGMKKEKKWSWQRTHARVTSDGDLEWCPEPFEFEAGDSVRYIDFEGGDDAADGTSRGTAWKHHPWDPQATDAAAEAEGVHTYVFKGGVTYRGRLVADESGEEGRPIRLTRDPSWGDGEAVLVGSIPVTGWQPLPAEEAPAEMPEPGKVWYADVGTDSFPRALWEVKDGEITRIHLAREPDWEVTNPDDVKSNWWEWENVEKETIEQDDGEQVKAWGSDAEHLSAQEPGAYEGGTVWTEYAGVMGTPYANPIEAYDPERNAIRFAGPWGDASGRAPILHCRYYIENLPRLLDQGGEYYYSAEGEDAGRLYLRLPGDRDPNASRLELARHNIQIDIRDQDNISITGLTFRFQNSAHWYDRWWDDIEVDPAAVKLLGGCRNVRVANCRFEHVMRAVQARSGGEGVMDRIDFTDNDIRHTDYGPIWFGNGGDTPPEGNLYRVKVLRNRLFHVGFRPMRSEHGHALRVGFALLPEIAGNVLDRCWGAGLFIFGGKGSGNRSERPLSRVLMHHNKVTDPLLNTNDWGGIESWQGGPTYIFNNISGNPGGYWHWSHVMRGETAEERSHTTARFGFAYYLDGAFKQYVFNNIAWGKSSDLTSPLCNSSGLQGLIGFLNSFFNNTLYRFGAGSRRQAPQAGRNVYLGNVWVDMGEFNFRHAGPQEAAPEPNARDAAAAGSAEEPFDYDTLAYANNVFHGQPRNFAVFEHTGWVYEALEDFRIALEDRRALATSVGVAAEQMPLRDPQGKDFRPAGGFPGVDMGVKMFVPWALYGVVGEWHFYKHPADPSRILGEHWYMTPEHRGRGMYRRLPRHDLTAVGVEADDFVMGKLEDWTEGALQLNGTDQFCVLRDEDLKADIKWGEDNVVPGEQRKTPDMDANSFLIEAYLRTEPGRRGGAVVSKTADGVGYTLDVDGLGRARMTIADGKRAASRVSTVLVNDGRWHHVVAEVDRGTEQGIRLYVDGRPADGAWSGEMPAPDASLSNTGDLLVGKEAEGNFFAGAIDFLRISRGTLADAYTSIEELYDWELDGPFLRDFLGRRPKGARDAGAFEK